MNVSPVSGHTQTPSCSSSRRPVRPTQPMRFAGTPATRPKSGTSRVTTEPAATSAHSPMRTGATHTERAPIAAPSPMSTPTASQSSPDFWDRSGLTARG